MRVLYVCTANICRSASAQQLLRDAVAGVPELAGIEVRSAGTVAMAGSPGCAVAPALAGHRAEHRSQPLTAELVAWADLILAAARDHRPAILALDPRARDRTFTIRQAGRIADWMIDAGIVAAGRERAASGTAREAPAGAEAGAAPAALANPAAAAAERGAWVARFLEGDPRREVEALPNDMAQRWRWVVTEMDAARGLAGMPPPDRLTNESHPDDVPDPHFLGMGLHAAAYKQIASSTESLVRLLREVAPGP